MTLSLLNHLTFIIVNKIKQLEFVFSTALFLVVTFMSLFFISRLTIIKS